MSKSTYYFELTKVDLVDKRNTELKDEIQKIFTEHKGRYGVRRVYQELLNRGFVVNHKRVQRLMHIMGLAGKRPKEKYHSYKGKVGKVAENIVNRDFSTTAPLQKWTTDVSQFNFSWGKCYLSPILDMNTNEIVAYDLALRPNLEQISRMLEKAFKKLLEVAKVSGVRFHDLRHTFAVNSIRAGDDIKTIQGNLGHASAAFTLDRYGHFTERMKQDSAARMENFITDVLACKGKI